MAAVATTIRIDESLKASSMKTLDSIGMNLSTFVTLALKQLQRQQRVPFELVASCDEPTEATRRAMVEAEAKELGLIPDDSARFSDTATAMAYLDAVAHNV